MTTKNYKKSKFTLFDAASFFFIIAFSMQMAILTYEYICQRTDDKVLIAILILILITIIASFCTLCDFIRRKIMVDVPVSKILDATEKIAAGNFDTRIDIENHFNNYNEFDAISENLNILAAELGKSEMLKNDFISNVSHEMKTPLAIIGNYADALADTNLDPETREKYAETLSSASKRLSGLVTDILKLNKLQNQEIKPEITRFNLSDTLAECILGFEDRIESKSIDLDCELNDVFISSSESLLEIVFTNLISNAVKFTEDGGSILVSLYESEGYATVTVTDTGCGMSSEVGMRIFEKFYQGDTSHSHEGNGLGLPLVKKVIDILGGEISVTSEVGKGSTFTVRLKQSL